MTRKQRRIEKKHKLPHAAAQVRAPAFDPAAALEAAARHHSAGRLREAEAIYRRVLQVQPNHPEALHLMGVLAHQIGENDVAVHLVKRAISVNGSVATYHHNLGDIFRALERFEKAVACYREAVARQPDYADAHFGLGNALIGQGKVDEAIASYRKALALHPGDAEAHNNLGNALMERGDIDLAASSYRKAHQLRPDYAEDLVNLGYALSKQGKLGPAVGCYRKALTLKPDLPEAHYNLGLAREDQGKPDEAIASYQRALELKPTFFDACLNLGHVLKKQGKPKDAVSCYHRALSLVPKRASAYNSVGTALLEMHDRQAAKACFEQALAIDPNHVHALNNLAHTLILQNKPEEAMTHVEKALTVDPDRAETQLEAGLCLQLLGRFEEAKDRIQHALAIAPRLSRAYYNLVVNEKFSSDDREIQRLERLLEDENLSAKQRGNIHYALAKVCDDLGIYDKAFPHLEAATALKVEEIEFNVDDHVNLVGRLISTFDEALFEQKKSFGVDSELPVFIVGMPRSGTSLTEQIISSHPQSFGAGELDGVHNICIRLAARSPRSTRYPECVPLIEPDTARHMAEDYLAHLREYSAQADRITDKMPANYLRLGVIALLFPKARIIHCRRDPLDTCLSCYFQNFGKNLRFTASLTKLGAVYRQYERIMAHWHKVLPVPVLDVQYEELVANQEEVSREIIDFCGLPWDDRCLAFYEHERGVATASFWQVRQPMYSSSIGRWRHYEEYLGALKEALAAAG